MTDIIKLSEYRDWLLDLKQQIKTGQIKAALSVNSRMIMLYWDLGRQIAEKQEKASISLCFLQSVRIASLGRKNKYRILHLQSVRIASLGRKRHVHPIPHSVRNAFRNKYLKIS
jgi:hypothetical protein